MGYLLGRKKKAVSVVRHNKKGVKKINWKPRYKITLNLIE